MSGDPEITTRYVAAFVTATILALVLGTIQCERLSTEAFKACLEAGKQLTECQRVLR